MEKEEKKYQMSYEDAMELKRDKPTWFFDVSGPTLGLMGMSFGQPVSIRDLLDFHQLRFEHADTGKVPCSAQQMEDYLTSLPKMRVIHPSALSSKKKSGDKFDEKKIRWNLLPWEALVEVVQVLEYGAKKYDDIFGPKNWQRVENGKERYKEALLRHLFGDGIDSKGYLNGEKFDKQTGRHHLAHVVTNALFVLWFELNEK